VGVRHVGEGLALEAPVTGLAGELQHEVRLSEGLVQVLGRGQHLTAPLMDLGQPRARDPGRAAPGLDGPRVQIKRHRIGIRVARPIAGAHQVLEGLGPVLSLGEVVRQLFIVLGQAVRIELLERVAHRAV